MPRTWDERRFTLGTAAGQAAECDCFYSAGGADLVVFVHAVGGDKRSYEKQLTELPARFTGVSIDLRGHGSAPLPPLETMSVEVFARDLGELIGVLGFESAHLVGLSMGGVVSMLTQRSFPEKVASLTLSNTWCHYGEQEAAARNEYLEGRLRDLPMLEGSMRDMSYLLAPGTPAEVVTKAAEIEGNKSRGHFVRSWKSMFETDLRAHLPSVRCPVLLISSEHDPVTPRSYLEAIQHCLPTATFAHLPGAGHFSNLDHPEAWNARVFSFLAEHGSRESRLPTAERISFPADTVAHALIKQLDARGIEVFFSNSGTDYVDVIDALARYGGEPDFDLRVVSGPHENTVISMAHGYALVTGRAQAVMGHVNVGTANMTMGIINAYRAKVPMLVLAGKTPWLEENAPGCRKNFVQWGQDTYDQASFREFLKWDYELKTGENLETVIDRALAIAESDPPGPVYLMLPSEVLAKELGTGGSHSIHREPRQRPAKLGAAPRDALLRAADLIEQAKNPLIVTAELGRKQGGPEALSSFANRLGAGVIEFGKHNFMNLPTDHPMHIGFDPVPAIREADLVISVECHVPYIPAFAKLGAAPKMIQLGVDPLAADLPMRSFPADLSLAGDPVPSLDALSEILRGRGFDPWARREKTTREHQRVFAEYAARADEDVQKPIITKRFLSLQLGLALDPETLIFNEYDLDPQLVPRTLPGTWFENSIASGLGWALGAALGAKIALPDRVVVATVGDGSYLFNVPLSAHFVAAQEKAPILVVIFNDTSWSTIKRSYRGSMPSGWAVKKDSYPLTDFSVAVDFSKVAESCGGVGIRVAEPEQLRGAIDRALETVKSGNRLVLLDVICERDDR